MRHRDDDIERFREDPVVKALTGPATQAELAGEAEAVAAFRNANPAAPAQRRSGARVAASGSVVVLALGLSGGVAAAYTNSFPTSVQQDLHDTFKSIGVPAPHHHAGTLATTRPPAPAPVVPPQTPPPVPSSQPAAPVASSPPSAPSSPAASPSVSASPTLPVVVSTATPSTTPTPAGTGQPQPATAQLSIALSATRVAVGQGVTVSGKIVGADGSAVAGRRVALSERVAGDPRWHRVGALQRTSADGQVSFSVSPIDRNVELVLRSRPDLHSDVARVVVVPIINVSVPPTPAGATAATVTVRVTGAEPGDTVIVRQLGERGAAQQAKLDASLTATFTLPVSQSQVIRYRVVVPSTAAHGAHSLAFYVPPSGG